MSRISTQHADPRPSRAVVRILRIGFKYGTAPVIVGSARRIRKTMLAKLYDAEADRYELRYGAEQISKVRDALELVPPRSPVLDAGCGTGILLRMLGRQSVGLDISESMLRIAGRGSRSELVLGDLERMPFRGGSFRTIYSITAVQLADNLLRAMSELARVAKDGGMIVISAHRATETAKILTSSASAAGLSVISERQPDERDLDRIVVCSARSVN